MMAEEQLKYELDAEDGRFLLSLRTELRWDKQAFRNLTSAMYHVALDYKGADSLPTWIAHGFWFCDTLVRDWTTHENFPRPEQEYYEKSLLLLSDLAHFLFVCESPYSDETLERLACCL